MGSVEVGLLAPLDSPLPPPPEGEILTEAQWRTLMAVADTIIPSIEVSSTPLDEKLAIQASDYASAIEQVQKTSPPNAGEDVAKKYLQENASSTPGFKDALHRQFGHYMREEAVKGIRVILSALE